jgi:signal transduction histidine kinase
MALSFRPRIALWSALLTGIVLLVFFAVSAWMVFDNMLEEADEELRIHTQRVALEFEPDGGGAAALKSSYFTTLSAEAAEVVLIEMTQVTVRDQVNRAPQIAWPEPEEKPLYTKKGWSVTRKIDHRRWREMSRTIGQFRIRMAIDIAEIEDEIGNMVKRYFRAFPLALIFIGIGAWWVAGRAVKPIQKIIMTAEHITPAGLSERIEGVESADELGRLARVLNRMMGRIEGAFQQQRRFSSDASHELRTPLTVMQGKIEAALQQRDLDPEISGVFVELQERVGQLRSIIDSLLLLSRSDAGSLVPDRGELSLAELLVDVFEDAEILAEEAGLHIETDIAVPVAKVSGDGRLLRLAISNLLTNAVKYNVADGGRGEIHCDLRAVDGGYAIIVRNTGPEISPADREKIFERFYRADPARGAAKPGFGLGLSLSLVIARAHGGDLKYEGRLGGMNVFVLRLPKATEIAGHLEE